MPWCSWASQHNRELHFQILCKSFTTVKLWLIHIYTFIFCVPGWQYQWDRTLGRQSERKSNAPLLRPGQLEHDVEHGPAGDVLHQPPDVVLQHCRHVPDVGLSSEPIFGVSPIFSAVWTHQGLSTKQVSLHSCDKENTLVEHHLHQLNFWRTLGGFHSNMNSRTQQQQSLYFNRGQFQQQPHPMLSRPGQLQYPPGGDYHNQFAGGYGPPPYCPPPVPQWSREEEEMKYGPFSDGEAETMRRSGTRSCKKMSRGRGGPTAPHYATMSRVQDLSSRQQSSFDSNDGQGSHSIKYTSQPQLNGSLGDYLGNNHRQYGGQDALTPLSIKTSITFPRQPATAGSIKPLTRQDNVRSSYDSTSQSNYPDLARHPLSYSVAPPPKPYPRPTPHVQFPSHMMTRSMVSNRQNSSDDGHFDYEHSRSSSLGDLWGFNGVQDMRMATPDGFKSLPYDSNVKLAINGVKKRTARSGAVKIDLTCADKSIRRPGSAPDLVGGEELASCHNSPGANSLRDKKNGSFKDRARSTSSESRENCAPKKVGISPGTRKVAFAGIEDDDSESESDKQSRLDSITSVEEDVWIKQPHRPPSSKRPPDPDTIPTTGVVIAKAAPPPPPPHQQTFQSSKLQQAQQQNKCNGIR